MATNTKSRPWEFIPRPFNIEDIFKNCNSLKYIDLFYSNCSYNYNYELLKDLTHLEGCLFNI